MFANLIVLILVSSWSLVFSQQPSNKLPDKVLIGATASITGRFQIEGQSVKNGYGVWEKVINDNGGLHVGDKRIPIQVIIKDDKSDPNTLLAIYQDFITKDRVNFILGPYSSVLCGPAQEFAEKNKIILVQGNGSADSLFKPTNKYTFGTTTPAQKELQSTLEMLKDRGAKTICIANEHEPYAMNLVEGVKKWAKTYNMQIVGSKEYPHIDEKIEQSPSEQQAAKENFEKFISEFKKAVPDIFIGCGHFFDAIRYVQISKKLDFSPKAFVLTIGPTNPKFIEILKTDANNIICSIQWSPVMNYKDNTLMNSGMFKSPQDYVARYKQYTGQNLVPSFIAAESTAAGLALQVAIQRAGSIDPEKVLEQLRKLDITTFFGPIKFDPTGKNVGNYMGVMQIQNGEPVLVGPKQVLSSEGYELIYPKPAWLL